MRAAELCLLNKAIASEVFLFSSHCNNMVHAPFNAHSTHKDHVCIIMDMYTEHKWKKGDY